MVRTGEEENWELKYAIFESVLVAGELRKVEKLVVTAVTNHLLRIQDTLLVMDSRGAGAGALGRGLQLNLRRSFEMESPIGDVTG